MTSALSSSSSSSHGPRCTQKFRRDYETSFALNLFALKLFVFIYADRFLPASRPYNRFVFSDRVDRRGVAGLS